VECSFAALIACFTWSNLYLDASAIALDDAMMGRAEWRVDELRSDGLVETHGRYVWVDDPFNPYGKLALGYQMQLGSVTFTAEVSRMESFEDSPENAVHALSVGMRWYPFRR
jgi:hypothetical protein